LDDITASFYCYSLYVKKDGLGHYRVEIDNYNVWPLSNSFQFEFVVSGIYTPLSEHADPLAPFERLFGQQPSSSSPLIAKPQLPLPSPVHHVDPQKNTHFGDPFMGMRIIKVSSFGRSQVQFLPPSFPSTTKDSTAKIDIDICTFLIPPPQVIAVVGLMALRFFQCKIIK
jgi:hypothetical protein